MLFGEMMGDFMMQSSDLKNSVDVIVRTRNSGGSLRQCLESASRLLPVHKFVVVDNHSSDDTVKIASDYGADIHQEKTGLGYATTLGINASVTENIVFLDSDVIMKDSQFYHKASAILKENKVGAVVGQAVGHNLLYGLPLSLTVMPIEIASKISIDTLVMSRENYFMQKYLRDNGYKVRYLPDAMVHNSTHRSNKHWPEWQGAWVRNTSGMRPRELAYSMLVVFLMLSNSRKVRNFLYIPIFQAKLVRGFVHPLYWQGNLTDMGKEECVEAKGAKN